MADARAISFLLIQQGDAAVAFRSIEGKQVTGAAIFAAFAEHVAEPPLIAGAAASAMILHALPLCGSQGSNDMDIESDDIEVSDSVTVLWEVR